ncbi:MAG: enoyl-CoA hydratase [Acetobacteraceae bacterium]|nr:enoyl-CoA hydratase [Acetobacteraceae bacterium]
MSEEFLVSVEDGVAVLTLNRPERLNALNRTMLSGLRTHLEAFSENRDVGCIVLTGAGRAFCSGGDVKVQAATAGKSGQSPEQRTDQLRASMEASRVLHDMPIPTIAMVNGVAAGAGMSLALACDLRIAGEAARMTTAFAKVGLSGDYGGTYFLTQLVGPSKARELYLTAELLDSSRLLSLGMVSRVVPDADLVAETMALAKRLAAGPRMAYRYIKRNMNVAEEGNLSKSLDSEAFGMLRCRETADHAEAAQAFVEKRPPAFTGR